VDEARHDGIAAHRFDEIDEANYRKALALAEPRYAPARHIAAWVLAGSTDAPASGSPLGHRHHDVSIEMIFWLQQTEVESNELGWIPQGWGAAFWQAADRPRTLRDILASWAGLSISICRTAFTV